MINISRLRNGMIESLGVNSIEKEKLDRFISRRLRVTIMNI